MWAVLEQCWMSLPSMHTSPPLLSPPLLEVRADDAAKSSKSLFLQLQFAVISWSTRMQSKYVLIMGPLGNSRLVKSAFPSRRDRTFQHPSSPCFFTVSKKLNALLMKYETCSTPLHSALLILLLLSSASIICYSNSESPILLVIYPRSSHQNHQRLPRWISFHQYPVLQYPYLDIWYSPAQLMQREKARFPFDDTNHALQWMQKGAQVQKTMIEDRQDVIFWWLKAHHGHAFTKGYNDRRK